MGVFITTPQILEHSFANGELSALEPQTQKLNYQTIIDNTQFTPKTEEAILSLHVMLSKKKKEDTYNFLLKVFRKIPYSINFVSEQIYKLYNTSYNN